MRSSSIGLLGAMLFGFGAGAAGAVDPSDYVADNGCGTGDATVGLLVVPADHALLLTDIHIATDEVFSMLAGPFVFEVRQSGATVQIYRAQPYSTNGFTQEKAVGLTLQLASPLVIDATNTLQIVGDLPASWSSVQWCASVSGQLVSLVALGVADPPAFLEDDLELAVFPNPSSGEQWLRFSTTEPAYVTLDIFDVAGRRVARIQDSILPAGSYELPWNGAGVDGAPVAAGTYFRDSRSASVP